MKRCPNCDRTFEDALTYCLVDGSILSAPFDTGDLNDDSPRTEVIPPSSVPVVDETERSPKSPATPTIPAMFQPAARPANQAQERAATSASAQSPYLLLGIIGGIVLLLILIMAVAAFSGGEATASYLLLMLARRSPMLLLCLGGVIYATFRWRRHPRVSLMTILGLSIYAIEGIIFTLFLYWLPRLMSRISMSSSAESSFYVVLFFLEDFVFAGVILLLVAAALSGRSAQDEMRQNRSRFENLIPQ